MAEFVVEFTTDYEPFHNNKHLEVAKILESLTSKIKETPITETRFPLYDSQIAAAKKRRVDLGNNALTFRHVEAHFVTL